MTAILKRKSMVTAMVIATVTDMAMGMATIRRRIKKIRNKGNFLLLGDERKIECFYPVYK